MRSAASRRLSDHSDVRPHVPHRPLIGITTSEVRTAPRLPHTPQADPARPEMALGMSYSRAVAAAGGVPVVLPPLDLETVEPLLDQLAGICLSGGPDIHPSAYGAQPQPELGPTWPELDAYELAVARTADAKGVPLFAICRGMQALNVARGGSLHQHLAGHRQSVPCEYASHTVAVAPGSTLSALVGVPSMHVNSFHHQAVAELGTGLRAVGRADDGVIEAIEAPGSRFVLGVQWHAEALVDQREHAALFSAFVDAARVHAAGTQLRVA